MNRTKGTKQLNCEVTDTLFDAFREFAKARGETLRTAIEQAMTRHIAHPPPPPAPPPALPPLPPLTALTSQETPVAAPEPPATAPQPAPPAKPPRRAKKKKT